MAFVKIIHAWLTAYYHGALAIVTLFLSSFKVGFRKYWTWKVVEKPACLDDKSLGTHGFLRVEDGVRIHSVVSGPEDKPLMVFLHGFPEFWFSWRHQIKEFQKDYRCVAFDMRGYNESDKPKGLAPYAMKRLMADVKDVILGFGYKSCILVAHDWGGGIAWRFSKHYAEFVDKLIVMNSPPRGARKRLLFNDPEQRKRSRHIFFHQVPYLPELMYKVENFKMIETMFSTSNLCKEEVDAYKHVFSQPGALTPPINYYRAVLQELLKDTPEADENYTMPVLLIWGCRDEVLSNDFLGIVEKEYPKIRVKRIEEGVHFVQMHKPEQVNKCMRDWLEE